MNKNSIEYEKLLRDLLNHFDSLNNRDLKRIDSRYLIGLIQRFDVYCIINCHSNYLELKKDIESRMKITFK